MPGNGLRGLALSDGLVVFILEALAAEQGVGLGFSHFCAGDEERGERGVFSEGAKARPGFGYGYNCAVVYDPPMADLPEGKGTFFWDGAAGTWFWIDPTNDIVFIGMIQRMGGNGGMNLQYLSRSVIYGALVDPAK